MFGKKRDTQGTVLLGLGGLLIDHRDSIEPRLVFIETIEGEVQAALHTGGEGERCFGFVHCRDV